MNIGQSRQSGAGRDVDRAFQSRYRKDADAVTSIQTNQMMKKQRLDPNEEEKEPIEWND